MDPQPMNLRELDRIRLDIGALVCPDDSCGMVHELGDFFYWPPDAIPTCLKCSQTELILSPAPPRPTHVPGVAHEMERIILDPCRPEKGSRHKDCSGAEFLTSPGELTKFTEYVLCICPCHLPKDVTR